MLAAIVGRGHGGKTMMYKPGKHAILPKQFKL